MKNSFEKFILDSKLIYILLILVGLSCILPYIVESAFSLIFALLPNFIQDGLNSISVNPVKLFDFINVVLFISSIIFIYIITVSLLYLLKKKSIDFFSNDKTQITNFIEHITNLLLFFIIILNINVLNQQYNYFRHTQETIPPFLIPFLYFGILLPSVSVLSNIIALFKINTDF